MHVAKFSFTFYIPVLVVLIYCKELVDGLHMGSKQ